MSRGRQTDQASWKQIAMGIGLVLVVAVVGFTATYFIASKLLAATPTVSADTEQQSVPIADEMKAQESTPAPAPEPTPPPEPKGPLAGKVIVIDPGHQAHADSSQEPIGPNASETKPKVTGGASGTKSKVPESQLVLNIGMQLKTALEAQGATVYMTRASEDVNVSNSQRAAVANDKQANLFLRLHCDGSDNSGNHGISMLVPANNQWTEPIVASSRTAGETIQKAVIAATGAKDNGVVNRGDLSGFNYCKVPSILIEMGFMSNPDEDTELNSSAYQQKLVQGLTQGCINWMSQQ